VVLRWCLFILFLFFFILYTKFLPDIVLRFQHIVTYILENWIKMVLEIGHFLIFSVVIYATGKITDKLRKMGF